MKASPRFDSFHFGMFTCAVCRAEVRGDARASEELLEPIRGCRGEVVIPAGRQSFHEACLVYVKPKISGRELSRTGAR